MKRLGIGYFFIIKGSGKCGGFCICDVGSSGDFMNLECILRLRKIFNSGDILDLSCRMDLFKTSPRYWWRHIDDDVTQECNITYFSFQLLISMPGRGDSLPRNTREVFPGGLSNPFRAKIGLRIQRRHSGGLKVPGTPLNFDFLASVFWVLVHLGGNLVIFPRFTVGKPQLKCVLGLRCDKDN